MHTDKHSEGKIGKCPSDSPVENAVESQKLINL